MNFWTDNETKYLDIEILLFFDMPGKTLALDVPTTTYCTVALVCYSSTVLPVVLQNWYCTTLSTLLQVEVLVQLGTRQYCTSTLLVKLIYVSLITFAVIILFYQRIYN